MYELGDDTWRDQPKIMSLDVAEAAANALKEHARIHGIPAATVLFHGGEPLLAGSGHLKNIMTIFRETGMTVHFHAQTNATLLTGKILSELNGIRFGVSLDDETSPNRVFRNGKLAAPEIRKGLALLREHREMYGGILSVTDISNDPDAVYNTLRAEEPPLLDFLLPLATHDVPPASGYGEWLARVYDLWHQDPGAPMIRMFHILVSRLLGRDTRSGFLGKPLDSASIVIQPDGSAELLDALRVTGNGMAKTGMNVLRDSLDDIAAHPGYRPPDPCAACHACEWFNACGGGYYPNRFSAVNGYDNRSVYCEDLTYLISHIDGRLRELNVI